VLGVVAAGPVCGTAAAKQLLIYRERTLQIRRVLLQWVAFQEVVLEGFDVLGMVLFVGWLLVLQLLGMVAAGPVCEVRSVPEVFRQGWSVRSCLFFLFSALNLFVPAI
jgi:hypothetical protein